MSKEKLYVNIPETELTRLRQLAKQNKEKMDTIVAKYTEKLSQYKGQGMKVNVERIAVNELMNDYRKFKAKQTATPFRKKREVTKIRGFIVGDRGIWDKVENIRKKAKAYIDKNGVQAALEAQLIDGDNNILDTREQIYGRDNLNYLKPLSPTLHVLERTLYGFFIGTDNKWKYGSIQTGDNRLARGWSKVKFFVPCEVPVVIKEETETDIKLSSSSAEETLSIFKAVKEDWDIQKIIEETITEFTPLSKVEEFHEKYKDAWDRRIFVKGIVAWIGIDRPTAIGSIRMGLMNPDNEDELVVVEIPEHLSIDFGELSELVIFGSTRRNKYYDEGELTEGDVVVMATGIFPLLATPKIDGSRLKEQEDVEIDGWLDE